jgi:flotillin
MKVQSEERLKSERARISADEEIAVANENKERQVLVAQRNKERTDAVEIERVTRDRDLEIIDRQRVTTLKDIEKEKAVEIERKNIQEVIKDRVALEKTVVIEQQKMKDAEAFATADREKQVALTNAEKGRAGAAHSEDQRGRSRQGSRTPAAEQDAFTAIKAAEASKQSAELHAQEILTLAEARQEAAAKDAAAEKSARRRQNGQLRRHRTRRSPACFSPKPKPRRSKVPSMPKSRSSSSPPKRMASRRRPRP